MKRIRACIIVSPFVICWIAMWSIIALVTLIFQTFVTVMSWQTSVARGEDCTFRKEWDFYYADSILEESVDNILDIFGV